MAKKLTVEEYDQVLHFWELLKRNIEQLPNRDVSKDEVQWSVPLNNFGDIIGLVIGDSMLQLYIKSGHKVEPHLLTQHMKNYSQEINKVYSHLGTNSGSEILEKGEESEGRSSRVERPWARSNRDKWFAEAQWVREQVMILQRIIKKKQ